MKTLYRCGVLALAVWVVLATPVLGQQAEPGTVESLGTATPTHKYSAAKVLNPLIAETGLISVSIDGVGSNAPDGADIQVEKPAGATVRAAYYMGAATFGSEIRNTVTISNGGNSLSILPADYDQKVRNASGANRTENGLKEITSFIEPIVDAAPAGIIDFLVTESGISPSAHEGNVIVVIFDDPSVTTTGTFVGAFGAQATTGDNFNISLGDPFDPATQSIEMSLAITFGYQSAPNLVQFSEIDVNGQRLTSSAGGQDDCDIYDFDMNPSGCSQNGSLFTVGGIGDDAANPPDPDATTSPDGARADDELYTLDDFIGDGDSQVLVNTRNPSNDDNIFFAGFVIEGTAAIVGEGIILGPTNATNPVGTDHTVTATVQDDDGNPISGRGIDFEITAGPNSGLTAMATTGADGKASFTWSSAAPGTDIVVASTVDSQGDPLVSNEAQKTWTSEAECDVPTLSDNIIDAAARTVSNTMQDQEGIQSFTFSVLDNFTVASVAPMAGFTRSGDTWTWTDAGDPPTSVDFTLQAGPNGEAFYFLEATDACSDPGPNTTDFDPPFDLGPSADLAFTLEGSYPNPTGGAAMVRFALQEAAHAQLSVYDVMGRKVATLVDARLQAGEHEARWNGRSADGSTVASGVYLLRLQAGERVATRRLTVVR